VTADVARPPVAPVADGAPRPRWSVMIPTFNCARDLRVTLESVLAQDPGPEAMQIEVVDDCSTADDPAAVVREVGRGRVALHRQPSNVGHTRNFNTCLRRARGHVVHLLHGDDFVRDGFYRVLGGALDAHPEVGAAFCRVAYVDGDGATLSLAPPILERSGIPDDWLATIAEGQLLQPPSIVVRREVYERLGGFDQRIRSFGEDWEMWVRIAASYPVWYETEALAAYRIQTGSLTNRSMRTGQNMRDVRTAIAINREVLPPDRAEHITRAARRANALGAIRRAHRAVRAGDLVTPLVQLREAVRTSVSPAIGYSAARLLAHVVIAGVGRLLPGPRGAAADWRGARPR